MLLRDYKSSDCNCLAELFYQTVHCINAKDYAEEQLNAVKDTKIVGFGDIDSSGYLDRLYVHKDHQRQGIASAICDGLERSVGNIKITTHASITAKPFFESRGYKVIKEQRVERQGIFLINYVMEK